MAAAPESVTPAPATPEPLPPKPRHRIRNLAIVVAVVVVAIVAGSVLWWEYQPGNPLNPYHVDVTQVVWAWQSNDTIIATESGFSTLAGHTQWLSVGLYCATFLFFAQTCNSGNVAIGTPGFGLLSTNTPFSWSSGSSGAGATVTIHVSLPTKSYSGELDIWIV